MMSDRPCLAEFHFGNANVSIEFALYTKSHISRVPKVHDTFHFKACTVVHVTMYFNI